MEEQGSEMEQNIGAKILAGAADQQLSEEWQRRPNEGLLPREDLDSQVQAGR